MNIKSITQTEINEVTIKKILDNFYNEDVIFDSVKLINGGLNNTTYYVKASNKKPVILRIAPQILDQSLIFDKHIIRNEPEIYRILDNHDIPVPKVLYSDFSFNLLERDYLILEYIDGCTLLSAQMTDENKMKVYEKAGSICSKIHTIEGKKFGRPFSGSSETFDSWNEYIQMYTDELCKKNYDYKTLDRSLIKRFESVVKNNQDYFSQVQAPMLIHSDFWQGNIMVKKVNDIDYDIIAVIDVERAFYGDSVYEFVLPHILKKSFFDGYKGNLKDKLQDYKMELYRLIRTMLDVYIFSVLFYHKEVLDDIKRKLHEKLACFND